MSDDTVTVDGESRVSATGVGPERAVEIVGHDGNATHIVQYTDGTVGIRTDGLRPSGHIVTIRPDGYVEITPVD